MAFNRSLAVKKQWRDRKGRWVEMGKGVRFYNSATGSYEIGKFAGSDSKNNARIKLPNGQYVTAPRSAVESYAVKARLTDLKEKNQQKASLSKGGVSTSTYVTPFDKFSLKNYQVASSKVTPYSQVKEGAPFVRPLAGKSNVFDYATPIQVKGEKNPPILSKPFKGDISLGMKSSLYAAFNINANSHSDGQLFVHRTDTPESKKQVNSIVDLMKLNPHSEYQLSMEPNLPEPEDNTYVYALSDEDLDHLANVNDGNALSMSAYSVKSTVDPLLDSEYNESHYNNGIYTLSDKAESVSGHELEPGDTFYYPDNGDLSTPSKALRTEMDGIPSSALVVHKDDKNITFIDPIKQDNVTVPLDKIQVFPQDEELEQKAMDAGIISSQNFNQSIDPSVDPKQPEYDNTLHTAEGPLGKKNPTRIINDSLPSETSQNTPPQPTPTTTPTQDAENPLDAFPDIVQNPPEILEGEKFAPTQEQQNIIDAVLAGKDVKVQALAGAGKTSTLEALSRRIQKAEPDSKAIYIAFNKSVQKEAEGRMPSNVEPRTGHSLAFSWASKDSKAKVLINKLMKKGKFKDFSPLRRNSDIAKHLNIDNLPGDKDSNDSKLLNKSSVTSGVVETVKNFQNSKDDVIHDDHLPERFEKMSRPQKDMAIKHAKDYWNDLLDPNGKLPITHDTYRKAWALSNPDLSDPGKGGGKSPANILYLDEGQDTPPVVSGVIEKQNMRKVLVGDQNQSIYGFSGATDYLSEAQADIELPMTESFRFGPQIADAGNRFLQLLGAKHRVKGGGPESSIDTNMDKPDAVLVRSNRGLIAETITELEKGHIVSTPKGTKSNLQSLVDSVLYLRGGFKKKPFNMHEDFEAFDDWGEVLKEISDNDDQNLKGYANLFDNLEIDGIEGLGALFNLRDKLKTIREPSEESEMVDLFVDPETGKLTLKDKMKIGMYKNSPIERLSTQMAKNNGVKVPYQKGKYGEYLQALEELGGISSRGWEYNSQKDQWEYPSTNPDSIADEKKQMEYDMLGHGDVTISTAHKSKGLEWDNVRIAGDFNAPEIDDATGEMSFPSKEELMLSYVAVTRAKKSLDPGGLGWVYDHTEDNGGLPSKEESSSTTANSVERSKEKPEAPATLDSTEDVDSHLLEEANESESETPSEPETSTEEVPVEEQPTQPEAPAQPQQKLETGQKVISPEGDEWEILAVSKKGNVIAKNSDGEYESFTQDEVNVIPVPPKPENPPVFEESPEPTPEPEPEAEEVPSDSTASTSEFPTFDQLEKIGKKLSGSNAGAIYRDKETGKEYYVKEAKSADHAKNEALTSDLYKMFGVPAANAGLIDLPSGPGIISEMVPGAKMDLYDHLSDANYLKKIQDGFAVDAYLANWDVIGLTFDNIVSDENGSPVRIDGGGALNYRGMGAHKGDKFTSTVGEIESMRNPQMNNNASYVYGFMSDEAIAHSMDKILSVDFDNIKKAIEKYYPEGSDLTQKMEDRYNDLKSQRDELVPPSTPEEVPTPAPEPGTDPISMNGQPITLDSHVTTFKANGDVWMKGVVVAISADKKRIKVQDLTTGKFSYRLPHKLQVDEGEEQQTTAPLFKTENKVQDKLLNVPDGEKITIVHNNEQESFNKVTDDLGDPAFISDSTQESYSADELVNEKSNVESKSGVVYSDMSFNVESKQVSDHSQDATETHPDLPANMGVDSLGFQYIENKHGDKLYVGSYVKKSLKSGEGEYIGRITAFSGGNLLGKRVRVEKDDGTISYRDVNAILLNDVQPEPNFTPESTPTPTSESDFSILPADQRGASGDGYHASGPWGKFGASGVALETDVDGEKKYLLVQRGSGVSSNQGKWQFPGGAQDENETPQQAAARELVEEVGVPESQVSQLMKTNEHVNDNGQGWSYTTVSATSPHFTPNPDGSETSDAQWFTAQEISNMKNNGDLHPALADTIGEIIDLPETTIEPEEEKEKVLGVDYVLGHDGSEISANSMVSWDAQGKEGNVMAIHNENKVMVSFDGVIRNLNPKKLSAKPLPKAVPEDMPQPPDTSDIDAQIAAVEEKYGNMTPDYSVPSLKMDMMHMFDVVKEHASTKPSYDKSKYYLSHGHLLVSKDADVDTLSAAADKMFEKKLISDHYKEKIDESLQKVKGSKEDFDNEISPLNDQKTQMLTDYAVEKKQWLKDNNMMSADYFNQNVPAITSSPSDNPENWKQAVGGTSDLASAMDYMSKNPQAATLGVSVLLDSDQVEDLNMKVIGFKDKDGVMKYQATFKIHDHSITDVLTTFQTKNAGHVALTTGAGFMYKTRKNMSGGLVADGSGDVFDHSAQKYTLKDDDTNSVISLTTSAVNDISHSGYFGESIFNGRVNIVVPQEGGEDAMAEALARLGLEKPHASSIDDVKRQAAAMLKNKIDGYSRDNFTDDELNDFMDKMKKKYNITYADIQVSQDNMGNNVFSLTDEGFDKISNKFSNLPEYALHRWSGDLVDMITSQTPGLMSTSNRYNTGIHSQSIGMSSVQDMRTGGASGVFTRIRHSKSAVSSSSGYHIGISARHAMRNLGSHFNTTDQYGRKRVGAKMYSDLSNDAKKGSPTSTNELVIPNGVDISMWRYIRLPNSQRKDIIKKLKERGIIEINGIPIEQFIVDNSDDAPDVVEGTVPVMDDNATILPEGPISVGGSTV